jgi:CubicO group peptidase (beta-lactamase class C family)
MMMGNRGHMKKLEYIIFGFLVLTLGTGALVSMGCGHLSVLRTSGLEEDDALLSDKVDRLFAKWDKSDSPGAAVVVLKNGKIVHQQGYGMANLEYGVPITPATIFDVASVSKQFTAMAIAILAKQGKISLDDDIRNYLPDIPDFGKTITIRHLLHHTSGLRSWGFLMQLEGLEWEDRLSYAHILQLARYQKELNFEPGEEYSYSNTGYTLLAEIVARVTGQSFREWTTINIFKPLGMTNTHFHDDHTEIVKNRASSYTPDKKGGFRNVVSNLTAVGSSSLFSTIDDLSKWIKNFEERRVGGAAVADQMFETGVLNNGKKLNYAFGLVMGEYRGIKTVHHSGGWAGFRSHIVQFPKQKFSVAVLSNLSTMKSVPLANQIADIYLADDLASEKQQAKPKKKKPVKVHPRVYDTYVGKYVITGGASSVGKIVTITKDHDRLMAQQEGGRKVKLFPESETTFFKKKADLQFSFVREENGIVNEFIVSGNTSGKDWSISVKRIQSLKKKQLNAYLGRFYSYELCASYTIIPQKGQLWLRHIRKGDIKLIPIGADQFIGHKWHLQQVYFERDIKNNVIGFRANGGDGWVRNLYFAKQIE